MSCYNSLFVSIDEDRDDTRSVPVERSLQVRRQGAFDVDHVVIFLVPVVPEELVVVGRRPGVDLAGR